MESTDAVRQDDNALMAVSRVIVSVFKERFGRGPTRARTYWAGPDILVTYLEDTLTPAERTLVQLGEHQRLREARLFLQYRAVREFCEPVEEITGRTVKSFFSSTDSEVDGASIEMFVFHPAGSDAPSRARLAPS